MKTVKYFFVLSALILSLNKKGYCQVAWDEGASIFKIATLSSKVIYQDSIYILNCTLKKDSGEKIFFQNPIQFKDYFSIGKSENVNCDGDIFLTKIVMGRDVIFAPNDYGRLYGMMFDSLGNLVKNKSSKVELKQYDSLVMSVKLNNIYPLEPGNYVVGVRIRVQAGKKDFYIYSDPVNFKVDQSPPQSADFHYW
jgi:hypothetical protein